MKILSKHSKQISYITNEAGDKISVIIPVEFFGKDLEDLNDILVSEERLQNGKFVPFE